MGWNLSPQIIHGFFRVFHLKKPSKNWGTPIFGNTQMAARSSCVIENPIACLEWERFDFVNLHGNRRVRKQHGPTIERYLGVVVQIVAQMYIGYRFYSHYSRDWSSTGKVILKLGLEGPKTWKWLCCLTGENVGLSHLISPTILLGFRWESIQLIYVI